MQSAVIRLTNSDLGDKKKGAESHRKLCIGKHLGVVCCSLMLPDYYGLDMITVLAFQIHLPKSLPFRKYIVGKLYIVNTQRILNIFVQVNADKKLKKKQNFSIKT